MKNLFFNLMCLLLVATASAQQITTITVKGNVTDVATGAPVADWPVYAFANWPIDSFGPGPLPIYFGSGNTDLNGNYNFEMQVDGNTAQVTVSTQTGCPNDPTGGTTDQKNAPIVNGEADADFEICPDLPPPPDCWADAWYFPVTGLQYQFQANAYSLDSTASAQYVWDFGDGTTSNEQNPVHTFPGEGFYDVTLTATVGNCTSVYPLQVWVEDFWNGSNGDSVLVSGYVYGLDSLPVPGWFVVAGVDPVFISNFGFTDSTGYYSFWGVIPPGDSVITISTYDCTGAPQTQTVSIVNWVASANFYVCNDVPPVPGCAAYIHYEQLDSLTYSFSADYWSNSDSSGVAPTYLWDFGDGNTSTEPNPTHTYDTDGIYTVSLNITDGSGCVAYACELVFTFGGIPIDTFWYGCQAMFYCGLDPIGTPGGTGNTINFIDVSIGAAASWNWDFGDGSTSTEQNPTHTYAADGLYTVTLSIETLDGCESTMTADVWVGNNPWNEWDCQAMFLPLPDSTATGFFFLDMSVVGSPITVWNWDFGDGAASNEQNPYHVYAQPGIYEVSLNIEADSCNSEFSFLLDTENPLAFGPGGGPVFGLANGVSSTKTPLAFEGLKLSPNPASSEIAVAFDSKGEKEFQLRVSDLSGKSILNQIQKANAGANAVRVDVSSLPTGLYLAQILTGKGVQTLKFAVQR